jgi:predicted outer membrane repeat protein
MTSNRATSYGGALFNPVGCKGSFSGCTVIGNYAGKAGGAVSTTGTLTMKTCTLINNGVGIGGIGGAISNGGPLNVTGCNFAGNNSASMGSSIYNVGGTNSRIINFNRFYANVGPYEIYNTFTNINDHLDARYNWWGSNLNPSNKVSSNVDASPWLVLKVNANPRVIVHGAKSIITADLLHDSSGAYHSPTIGHIINGLTIKFGATLIIQSGTKFIFHVENVTPNSSKTVNGTAKTTLITDSTKGNGLVTATLDKQSVSQGISVT